MDLAYLIKVISFSASIFSAFFCLVLILMKLFDTRILDFVIKKLYLILIALYIVNIAYYIPIFLYQLNVYRHWWFKVLNFQLVILIPVILYHLIFLLCRIRKNQKFNYWHYVICLVIGGFYLLYNVIDDLYLETILINFDIKGSKMLEYSRLIVRTIYNTIYLILVFRLFILYRKTVSNYFSDSGHNSLLWLNKILVIMLLLYPSPIIFYLFPNIKLNLVFGHLIPNFLFMLFNITLCYNIFSQNFALNDEVLIEDSDDISISDFDIKESTIVKSTFEKYILTHKPFLNPQLKITDLLSDLMTNRTYLSSFINTTYKMNFSQFINACRFKEYLKLKKKSSSELNEMDLVLASGFRSYESFKRTEMQYYKAK